MSFLKNIFGNKKQDTEVKQVTDCRLWKCPKCGEILTKGALGTVWLPGEPLTKVAGTANCSRCNTSYSQSEIYGGRYDVDLSAKLASSDQIPTKVSVVVFRIKSQNPPSDEREYCKKVVNQKYSQAEINSHYIVGFKDDLSVDEALVIYGRLVKTGQLPDLGRQFDAYKGSGPDGGKIVALFFHL